MNTKAEKLAKTWSYNWYGFWSAVERYTGKSFDVSEYVDKTWFPPDKDKLIEYLKKSPYMIASSNQLEKCSDCNEKINTLLFRSDGLFCWPDNLAHDVEKHSFRIPNRFVAHIRERNYLPPPADEVDMENVDWP